MTGILDERIEHAIRDSFSRQGLMTTMSAGIDEIAPGRVTLSLPIGPAVSQQHGFAHAGASFALGDSAAGYAALTLMAPDSEVLTVEMKINLMAPAAGTRLIALGEVVRAGRRLTVVQARLRCVDAAGHSRDTGLMQGTMIRA
jgi:uncharacterized protein (TIGR00369 family)